jgi:putative hydrolase of the HAD superfamily
MMPRRKVFVFDLDDTLYKEVDYLKSAFREIASFLEFNYGLSEVYNKLFYYWQNGENAFENVIKEGHLPLHVEDLLKMYRAHRPQITLGKDTRQVLDQLHQECVLGIITDGRSLTQRNKMDALGLDAYIEHQNLFISEETGYVKPSPEPFRSLMKRYPDSDYYYIGDNPAKDFMAPNQLGWTTVCLLDDGRNIHPQVWPTKDDYLPQKKVSSILELLSLL